MKNSKLLIFKAYILIIILYTGCIQPPIINEPDFEMFNQKVLSNVMQDSLKNGVLLTGMPYFVVSQLFLDWPQNNVKIPVASLGSKQRLQESEGWSRAYSDPNQQIFMDVYNTAKGELKVWYQFPDYYRMDISQGDTLCIFLEDTVVCSAVKYLNKSRTLTLKDEFPQVQNNTDLYGEIKYKEHSWRKVSYWFTLQKVGSTSSFTLKNLNYEIYPIELLELDDEPVTSFKWR